MGKSENNNYAVMIKILYESFQVQGNKNLMT